MPSPTLITLKIDPLGADTSSKAKGTVTVWPEGGSTATVFYPQQKAVATFDGSTITNVDQTWLASDDPSLLATPMRYRVREQFENTSHTYVEYWITLLIANGTTQYLSVLRAVALAGDPPAPVVDYLPRAEWNTANGFAKPDGDTIVQDPDTGELSAVGAASVPSGPAGGDLAGTYPDPTIGVPGTDGQVLTLVSGAWAAADPTGGGGGGTLTTNAALGENNSTTGTVGTEDAAAHGDHQHPRPLAAHIVVDNGSSGLDFLDAVVTALWGTLLNRSNNLGDLTNFNVARLFLLGDTPAASVGDVPTFTGTDWVPTAPSGGGGGSLTVDELDGSPSVSATHLTVPNRWLTDNGGGHATLAPVFDPRLTVNAVSGALVTLGGLPGFESSLAALYLNQASPGSSNYAVMGDGTDNYFNSPTKLYLRVGNANRATLDGAGLFTANSAGATARLGGLPGSESSYAGLWVAAATPDSSNYTLLSDGSTSFINGATGLLLRVGNATKASLDATTTADDTALQIWNVNSSSLKRVVVGAADSGGSGYRMLRITN